MQNYAFIHLPGSSHVVQLNQLSGDPEELSSPEQLGGRSGFAVAPFHASADTPILLLHPDRLALHPRSTFLPKSMPAARADEPLPPRFTRQRRQDYHTAFAKLHRLLADGTCQKLVLSRCIDVPRTDDTPPVELFRRATAFYPNLTTILVSTRRSGTWLVATPEVLLSGEGFASANYQWRTMALAATRTAGAQQGWGDKEIREQRHVASYLAAKLHLYAADYSEEGPRTVAAGHLEHLRTDFAFTLSDGPESIGRFLASLHPTPAVCGLPKDKAQEVIIDAEPHQRRYYSGFMGPLCMPLSERPGSDFELLHTHLYVTLRCMEILPDAYRLYAGGGLLADSDEEREWQETEAKLQTMRKII